jgi:hypothetical protein
MKLLPTAIVGLALLASPALAQTTDPDPSPSQRALQKPNSSDPAASAAPDSSASSGESTGDAGYAEPSMDPDADALEPDEADRKAAEPDGPRE